MKPNAWRAALARFDAAWQRVEARLCAAVLVAEIAALTSWVSLQGLASDYVAGGNASGLVFRAVLTATLFGLVAHQVTRRRPELVRRSAVTGAVVLGWLCAGLWVHVAVGWSSNALNWLQNASTLTLIGGLRGLATRLTLWLALLGASLATSRGRHIHVDVLVRDVPARLRAPAALLGGVTAAVVSSIAALGFVDYISIAEFRASAVTPCREDPARSCDTPARAKAAAVGRALRSDLFLLGRQVSLDARSFPEVMAGKRYDRWMHAAEWNAWLDGAPWSDYFEPAAVQALRMPTSDTNATRMPQVAVPGTGEDARGLLIRELNFVFPLGLAAIAIKLLLRAVLLLAGVVEPDSESTPDDDLGRARGSDEIPNEPSAMP